MEDAQTKELKRNIKHFLDSISKYETKELSYDESKEKEKIISDTYKIMNKLKLKNEKSETFSKEVKLLQKMILNLNTNNIKTELKKNHYTLKTKLNKILVLFILIMK
jgi:hypothetical protein